MATMISPREIREHSIINDAEFQRLSQEHSSYEEQLQQLSRSPYRSSEAILLEAELKKMKLKVKDQMLRLSTRLAKSA